MVVVGHLFRNTEIAVKSMVPAYFLTAYKNKKRQYLYCLFSDKLST